ncbi:MAG: ribbon-helix-helix domain-containing protein [Lachnospiraceae bacterium]|nr:ribbon-helix-helix domain-containing protein [Lachnospiraceae bacterium]
MSFDVKKSKSMKHRRHFEKKNALNATTMGNAVTQKGHTAGKRGQMAEKIGISLDKETLQLCDKYSKEHSRSCSEFVAAAIQKYVSDLELGRQKNIIAKELAGEIVKGSEAGVTKISKGLFRYAVEVEMIIMILSELTNIPRDIMEEYRKEAIRNVRRTRGKINLDDLIARNNREFVEQKISTNGIMGDEIFDEYTIDDYDFMEDDT